MTTLTMRPGQYKHVKWMDLYNDGKLYECAIVKEDSQAVYFIKINDLDNVDKTRLGQMLRSRNAENLILAEIMAGTTLKNGINALKYFHQLTKKISRDGVMLPMATGVIGAPTGVVTK